MKYCIDTGARYSSAVTGLFLKVITAEGGWNKMLPVSLYPDLRKPRAWSAVAHPMRCALFAVQKERAAVEEPCAQLGAQRLTHTDWHVHQAMKWWSQPGSESLKLRLVVSQLLLLLEKESHLLLSWLCPWWNLVNLRRDKIIWVFVFYLVSLLVGSLVGETLLMGRVAWISLCF